MARQQSLFETIKFQESFKRPRIEGESSLSTSDIDYNKATSSAEMDSDSGTTEGFSEVVAVSQSSSLTQCNSLSQTELLEFGVLRNHFNLTLRDFSPRESLAKQNPSIALFSLLGLIMNCGLNGFTGRPKMIKFTAFLAEMCMLLTS